MGQDEAESTAEGEREAAAEDDRPELTLAAETAAEVLGTLLRLMGIDGKVEVLSYDLPIALNAESGDVGVLIGHRGQTLASLEYITKLIVAARMKSWCPLCVDVAGYRERRREALQRLAMYLAEQVVLQQRDMGLEPMPAGERRIIHLTLADHPDVATHSIGDGRNRKVVISPR